MSSLVEKFVAAGAEVVAGSVIFNRKTVVLLRADQEIITPDGEQELKQIERTVDAEVVEVKPARKTTKGKAEKDPAAPPAGGEPSAPEGGGTGSQEPPAV